MQRLAPFALVLLTACSSTEFTILAGQRSVNGESAPAIRATLTQRFGKRGVCMLSHDSNPLDGHPFNGKEDTAVDMGGCGLTFRPHD